MEQKMENLENFTKENQTETICVSQKEAEEYRAYKRRKRINEISSVISLSEGTTLGGEDVQRVCERARRLNQSAVKTSITKLNQAAYYLSGSKVALDCVVGGTGETLSRVKALETRQAVKRHAKEITLMITPSFLDGGRYGEIRKEMRRVKRAAKRAALKVRVEKKAFSPALSRVARIACESGAKYLSVPYFSGCERLKTELWGGCKLEVSGVEKAEDFKRLTEAGVGRIVTDRAWDIYSEWLKEADKPTPKPHTERLEQKPVEKIPLSNGGEMEKEKTAPSLPLITPQPATETEYRCRLEGADLKFT